MKINKLTKRLLIIWSIIAALSVGCEVYKHKILQNHMLMTRFSTSDEVEAQMAKRVLLRGEGEASILVVLFIIVIGYILILGLNFNENEKNYPILIGFFIVLSFLLLKIII